MLSGREWKGVEGDGFIGRHCRACDLRDMVRLGISYSQRVSIGTVMSVEFREREGKAS